MFSTWLLHNHLMLWGWVLLRVLSERGVVCVPPGAPPSLGGSQNFPPLGALLRWEGSITLAVPATSKEPLEPSPCLLSGLSTYGRTELQFHKWAILNSQISARKLRVHLNIWRQGGSEKTDRCMWGNLRWPTVNNQARAGFRSFLKGGSSPNFWVEGQRIPLTYNTQPRILFSSRIDAKVLFKKAKRGRLSLWLK